MTPSEDSKKKVLFVITKSNFGGAQKYVYDLATSMCDKFEVVVAFGGEGILSKILKDAGIRTCALPSLGRDVSLGADMQSLKEIFRLIEDERPDILHLNSSKVGLLGGVAGRLAGVPRIIFTAHGWPFNEHRGTLSRMILKALSWFTVILSHKTIAVSRAVAKNLPHIGTQQKMMVINNGIAPRPFLSREDARKKFNLPADSFIIGTIAELHASKGLSDALEAFAFFLKMHPDAHYAIIGEGEERGRLEHFIKERGLTGHVVLAGFIPEAAGLLKAFDVFLLPSHTEALGYVLLEAGLAELPIVATSVGGIPEIIKDGETGILVPPKDSESIACALAQAYEHSTKTQTQATNLAHIVKENFSLDRMTSETRALYMLS